MSDAVEPEEVVTEPEDDNPEALAGEDVEDPTLEDEDA